MKSVYWSLFIGTVLYSAIWLFNHGYPWIAIVGAIVFIANMVIYFIKQETKQKKKNNK